MVGQAMASRQLLLLALAVMLLAAESTGTSSGASRADRSPCRAALQAACPNRADFTKCAECSGTHQRQLQAAGCNSTAITGYCHGDAPPSLSHFPGSRIVTNLTWGASVNSWANKTATQIWARCYSSFTDNHDTAATFHAQCDKHNTTMVFAINSLNYTFGGYVRSLFTLRF